MFFFIAEAKWRKKLLYDTESNVNYVVGDVNTVDIIQDRLSCEIDSSASNYSKFKNI